MAWGYDSSNGLFTGYEVSPYGTDAGTSRKGPGSSLDQARIDAYANLGQRPPTRGGSYRVASGGGSSGGGSKSSRTVTRVEYSGDMPTYSAPTPVEFAKVDPRKIRALQQKAAAPNIRMLNEKIQSAMNVNSDNPNVRRMTLREALQGYGTGLETTMAGAGAQARSEHQQELNVLNQEKQLNFQAQQQAAMAQYQAAMNKYLASATKITDTNSMEDGGGDGGTWYRTSFGSLRYARPGESRYGGTY